jgi:formylglycine-generating enzyme required for sulfatase activity
MKRRSPAILCGLMGVLLFISLACSVSASPSDIDQISNVVNNIINQITDIFNQLVTQEPGTSAGNGGNPPENADIGPAPTGMVAIPAGNFQMGWDPGNSDKWSQDMVENETPLHTVYLDGYFMDINEVTNSEYAQCVTAGVCEAPPTHWNPDTGGQNYNDAHYYNPQYGNYPVVLISWDDANHYCSWVGKSLPTEAQWEKAARGNSDTRMYPWGNTPPDCSMLDYFDEGGAGFCGTNVNGVITAAVGSYPQGASPYSVMDMAGNVAEYVQDWMIGDYYTYYEPNAWPSNPMVGDDLATPVKVIRGGAWNSPEFEVRVSARGAVGMDGHDNTIGFRCASNP